MLLPPLQIISHFLFIHIAIYIYLDIILNLDAQQNRCTKKVKVTYNLERMEYLVSAQVKVGCI